MTLAAVVSQHLAQVIIVTTATTGGCRSSPIPTEVSIPSSKVHSIPSLDGLLDTATPRQVRGSLSRMQEGQGYRRQIEVVHGSN